MGIAQLAVGQLAAAPGAGGHPGGQAAGIGPQIGPGIRATLHAAARHWLGIPARAQAQTPRRMPAAERAGVFVWIPVALGTGIGLWFALPAQPDAWFFAAFTALGLVLLAMSRGLARTDPDRTLGGWPLADAVRVMALGVLLAAAGAGLAGLRAHAVAAPVLHWRYYGPVEGRVVAVDRSARDKMRLTLDRVVLRDLAPDRTPARVRISLPPDAGQLPAPGTQVMLTGHLGPPPGPAAPGSHDFRRQAWFDRLGAVGYTRTRVLTVQPPPPGGILALHRLRMDLGRAMRAHIPGQAGAVAAALMTGDRSGIVEATNDVMRVSNLYHIVSISGLHMGMLAAFVYNAVRLLLVGLAMARLGFARAPHKVAAGAAIVAAGAYLWLSGGDVATQRAFVMVSVMLGAILADRRAISLRTVALAALVILLIAPEAVIAPGFQMSFAATLALILMQPLWQWGRAWVPLVLRPAAMLALTSIVAGAATSPLAAAHFNRMAEYGLLANLLAVPAMALVMPAGVIAAVLAPIGLAGPALWVMGAGCHWLLVVAGWIAARDGAVTAVSAPPGIVVPLMATGALAAGLLLRRPARGRPVLPLVMGVCGVLALAGAGLLWWQARPPVLLVAAEGEAAGLLTPQGRAMSKAKGGAFAVGTWLTEDGDMATPQAAGARPGWTGPPRDRQAALGPWRIRHLTGKGAANAAENACRRGVVLVVDDVAGHAAQPFRTRRGGGGAGAKGTPRPCVLLDLARLRRTGAVALSLKGGGLQIVTAAQKAGKRPWSTRAPAVDDSARRAWKSKATHKQHTGAPRKNAALQGKVSGGMALAP